MASGQLMVQQLQKKQMFANIWCQIVNLKCFEKVVVVFGVALPRATAINITGWVPCGRQGEVEGGSGQANNAHCHIMKYADVFAWQASMVPPSNCNVQQAW